MIVIDRINYVRDGIKNIKLHVFIMPFVGTQARQPLQHVTIVRSQADAVCVAEEGDDQRSIPLIVAGGVIHAGRPVRGIKAEEVLGGEFCGCLAQFRFVPAVREAETVCGISARDQEKDAVGARIGRHMTMGCAPARSRFASHVSGGLAQLVVRCGVGDGIEAPQKIFPKARESSVIRCRFVEKVERAIDGGVAVVQGSRARDVDCCDGSDETTEEEAHAGIIEERGSPSRLRRMVAGALLRSFGTGLFEGQGDLCSTRIAGCSELVFYK